MLNRVSLNTIGLNRIGLNRIGKPSRGSSDRPYIDPEVLASLKAVCICYGKSNDDPDRAIVKNLVDPDNPFVISNAAYDKMSSYGGYEFAKFDNTLDWYNTEGNDSVVVVSRNGHSITLKRLTGPNFWYFQNSTFRGLISNVIPFKVNSNKNIAVIWDVHGLSISEGKDKSVRVQELVLNPNEDNYTNLKTLNEEELAQIDISTNSLYYLLWFDLSTLAVDEEVTIEMLPLFEGAFVTDGIDDLITSTKSATEMLDGSNEITVVSMIHQIKTNSDVTRNNWFFTPVSYLENRVVENKTGKTGIYGYTSTNVTNAQISDITPILGDKNDYTLYSKIEDGDRDYFTVEGFQNQGIWYVSSIAWYWTIIANKVLTTDQINQVIAYFNLDRTLKPDILCNTIKQGITNENHAEFGDKMIDFSGNGRDIQLNNIAWKGDSGIGKYNFSNINIIANRFEGTVTTNKCHFTKKLINTTSNFCDLIVISPNEPIKFKVSGLSDGRKLFVANKSDSGSNYYFDNGEHEVSLSFSEGVGQNNPFGVTGDIGDIDVTVEFIPSHAGALCLDGVNDFGKVTGMPIYKDYTVVADYVRTFAKENVQDAPILSKSQVAGDGAFLFNYLNVNSVISSYSFGTNNVLTNVSDSERKIYYQSKYVNGGKSINSGTGTDYDSMWLGTYRDDSQIFFTGAIYSLMTFPYSMSEFLIERQLKKHKLGTLYPDMVEWRPIYTSNVNDYTITKATYFGEAGQRDLALGNHYPIGARFRIYVKPSGAVDEVTSIKVNGVELTYDYIDSNYGYAFNGTLSSKSPQKIDIAIDEYIRYEDIVQPYPAFYEFTDEDRNLVTWGSKVKVGTTITRIKAFADSNLLKDLYTISYPKLNGISSSSSKYVVERQMVFTCTATWIFDDNEPNCILSPRLLRIPNSSYKILRHIPDISGHGNHGVIYNSAYAEGSGVNEDGSYQFDGVDDFVIIPTLSKSGKQVLMKINWNTEYYNRFIVDFRKVEGDTNYIINDFNALSNSLAYQNANKTYIDGILNNSIKTLELKGVTHNIVSQFIKANSSPYIGARTGNGDNMTMSLYDFMLFDEISTDEEILTLNEYVGIEGNTDDLFTENN